VKPLLGSTPIVMTLPGGFHIGREGGGCLKRDRAEFDTPVAAFEEIPENNATCALSLPTGDNTCARGLVAPAAEAHSTSTQESIARETESLVFLCM
jgi:hypothetical protein